MSLSDKFISQDNKHLLWELMVDNNIFTGISNNYVNQIKADFEKKILGIKNIIAVNDNILDLNKKTILLMIEEIKKYKEDPLPVTSAEVLTKKQAQFQKGLQTRQEEFTRLIQPVKPQIIDFTDKINDEPIGSEMDIKLSQTIAWREKQLSQVLEKQNPVEANEWINNGKKVNVISTSGVNTSGVNTSNHIKIGDPTKIDESSFINLKKVSFAEDNVNLKITEMGANAMGANAMGANAMGANANTFNFMDKLKKKEVVEAVISGASISGASISGASISGASISTANPSKTPDNTVITTELNTVKTELNSIRNDLNKLLLDIKLILDNQENIIDKLDQVAFQTGSII